MLARFLCLAFALISLVVAQAGDAKLKLQNATTEPPSELAASIKKLLPANSIQLFDPTGKQIGEFWFRSEIPVDATPEQIKNGLTYREIRQSEILGAVRLDADWKDYRKQKIKAGVYTLRLGYQPMDGDHQGASEFQDFLVVTAATKDTGPELIDAKEMIEKSAKSIDTGHPGVFMLFPVPKSGPMPELTARPRNHVVLNVRGEPVAQGKKTGTTFGVGMTVQGHAD